MARDPESVALEKSHLHKSHLHKKHVHTIPTSIQSILPGQMCMRPLRRPWESLWVFTCFCASELVHFLLNPGCDHVAKQLSGTGGETVRECTGHFDFLHEVQPDLGDANATAVHGGFGW